MNIGSPRHRRGGVKGVSASRVSSAPAPPPRAAPHRAAQISGICAGVPRFGGQRATCVSSVRSAPRSRTQHRRPLRAATSGVHRPRARRDGMGAHEKGPECPASAGSARCPLQRLSAAPSRIPVGGDRPTPSCCAYLLLWRLDLSPISRPVRLTISASASSTSCPEVRSSDKLAEIGSAGCPSSGGRRARERTRPAPPPDGHISGDGVVALHRDPDEVRPCQSIVRISIPMLLQKRVSCKPTRKSPSPRTVHRHHQRSAADLKRRPVSRTTRCAVSSSKSDKALLTSHQSFSFPERPAPRAPTPHAARNAVPMHRHRVIFFSVPPMPVGATERGRDGSAWRSGTGDPPGRGH